MQSPDLLVVDDVRKTFQSSQSWLHRLTGQVPPRAMALDGVSFHIPRGTTFGLVGESGCGKSTLARIIAGLMQPDSGSVSLLQADGRRPRMQMIFQDPFSSLNSRWRIDRIIAEPIHAHRLRSGKAVRQRVDELLEHVGLSPADATKYPHEFSGGQRQRISIARALAGEPTFLICDEPTSALDVSVQAQILNLLKDLQAEFDLTYLFITHNLSVVRVMAHQIGVMYLGQLIEVAEQNALFDQPAHPYAEMLLKAVPDLDVEARDLHPIPGEVPSLLALPTGCRFQNRCPWMQARCAETQPPMSRAGNSSVRCFIPRNALAS
ncbi:ABC transporter ATP-binding protein [Mesorhizobium loti]|nr:ABC transporter ATP-binding protein [Mesorhizobium loti]